MDKGYLLEPCVPSAEPDDCPRVVTTSWPGDQPHGAVG